MQVCSLPQSLVSLGFILKKPTKYLILVQLIKLLIGLIS